MDDGSKAAYYALINTAQGDKKAGLPSALAKAGAVLACSSGKAKITWKYKVYEGSPNLDGFKPPSHWPPVPAPGNPGSENCLINECSHKPWRPGAQPFPQNAVGSGEHTIAVYWNFCNKPPEQNKVELPRSSQPDMGIGPNRRGN